MNFRHDLLPPSSLFSSITVRCYEQYFNQHINEVTLFKIFNKIMNCFQYHK